ncbi:50S ribosomal protein L28 [Candidatus Campbellbacteria bacterium]|nr:MAG: 50S ribosomal protein L28 [Candidatus Campbellbacteria bacterium]
MSKKCDVTKKSSTVGGGYSNRIRATEFNPTGKKRKQANIQKKRVFVEETGKTYNLNLSTRAIKTIAKHGAYKVLKKANIIK